MGKKARARQGAEQKKTTDRKQAGPRPPLGGFGAPLGRPSTAAIVAVGLALLLFAAIRLRVADTPIERDEGEYAYAGQLLLQGFPPYQQAYNMKFPGTYYAYAAIMAVFGQTVWGIHAGLLVVNAATTVLLFLLGRRLLRDDLAAAAAAIAFGFLSIDRWILGIFGHATHFVVLAAVAGLYVLLRALDSNRKWTFLAAGSLLGLSLLMKQNGIFFIAAGLAIAAWNALTAADRSLRRAIIDSSLVAAGAAAVFGGLCALLAAQGVFGRFWFWTIQYAREYVSEMTINMAWSAFKYGAGDVVIATWPFWGLAGLGAVLLWTVRWSNRARIPMAILIAASAASVCPGLYFRQHYFILFLPAAALLVGAGIASLARMIDALGLNVGRVAAAALFLFATVYYVVDEQTYLFAASPAAISRSRYGSNLFVDAPEVARYIKDHSQESDRIAVLGSEPEIYFLANRKSATGYIYTYALMELQPYAERMQDEMIQEVTDAHPKYIVYVTIDTSWIRRRVDDKIFRWMKPFLDQCYDPVGVVNIPTDGPSQILWDEELQTYQQTSNNILGTFKAKSDAPCSVDVPAAAKP